MVNVVLLKFLLAPIALAFLPLILVFDILRRVTSTVVLHTSTTVVPFYTVYHFPVFSLQVLLAPLTLLFRILMILELSLGDYLFPMIVIPLLAVCSSFFTVFGAILPIIFQFLLSVLSGISQRILVLLRFVAGFLSAFPTLRTPAVTIPMEELSSCRKELLAGAVTFLAGNIRGIRIHDLNCLSFRLPCVLCCQGARLHLFSVGSYSTDRQHPYSIILSSHWESGKGGSCE